MSEYYMSYTGAELDSAINKVKSGYVYPTETINITQNVSDMDITNGKTLNVNVPIKYFATGIVSNVTAGQQMTVSGIKDSVTGEAFTPKGIVCFICPTATTNYSSGQGGKPAIVMFYKDYNVDDGGGIAAYSSAYVVRINPSVPRDYLTVSGNSFTYKGATASMYGLMPATRWRWAAWG